MIISASRRTDIPAWYSEWFMNRVRAGWCQVPNPLNYHQLFYVSLKPEDTSTIVFWSKNPEPMLAHLDELDTKGFRYYFQFTLNDYPLELEPSLPSISRRIDTFKKLSKRLDAIRVIWRYDPIIISNITPMTFHINKFSEIAESLKGYTHRVMISFVDYYKKTSVQFKKLQAQGFEFIEDYNYTEEAFSLLEELAQIAKENGIEISTCAEEVNYSKVGVAPGWCIDPDLIYKIWSIKVSPKKDLAQRNVCLCAVSKDIGVNDTCLHGCTYCYATQKRDTAERRHSQHDPNSAVLWGNTRPLSDAEQAHLYSTKLL